MPYRAIASFNPWKLYYWICCGQSIDITESAGFVDVCLSSSINDFQNGEVVIQACILIIYANGMPIKEKVSKKASKNILAIQK